jgi:diacylglycerol kinase (ATP)
MEREFRDLDQRLELYLDGVRAELPSIESVVVLNIPSWGAGVHLWNMGTGMLNIYNIHSWELEKLSFLGKYADNKYIPY